jgi:CO/xanthine dehydrogenase Mo-binding subunit
MIVGRLLERAAREMRTRLNGQTPASYFRKHGSFVVTSEYERPAEMHWDDDRYRGDAYGSFGWGCNVVELEVDPATWEVKPTKVTAVVEIGKAIHPIMAAGQVEGGTAQGVGYALLEEVVMRDGRMANPTLTNYIIPTPPDTPLMETIILERPYKHGPVGAKGVGEMPIDGPAPAVVNALRHVGFDIRAIPATPERLMTSARLRPARRS